MLDNLAWWIWVLPLYIIGTLVAIDALWQGRTAQSTIAWFLGLIFLPFPTLPLYAFFGSRRFRGYMRARRHGKDAIDCIAQQALNALNPWKQNSGALAQPLVPLFGSTPIAGNHCTLLTSGQVFYQQMFDAIEAAQHSIVIQFYILRDDQCGQTLANLLIEKARAGICVYVLYDEIGSTGLRRQFVKHLRQSDVQISRFNSTKLFRSRLQLNFRNHRKLVVCDGHTAFVGGYNFGEEYLGDGEKRLFWRDTHVKIVGPAALSFQIVFTEDWHWATHQIPTLHWQASESCGADKVMCIATGPADHLENASLYFTQLIQQSQLRCWLVSPYFVPNAALIVAIQLACLRGVDVRILIPEKSDNAVVDYAARNYIPTLQESGAQFFSYRKGFLHQKVILIDDNICSIGSSNLDNRSLHLNFETNALIHSPNLALQVKRMLEQDFKDSVPTQINPHWWPTFLSKCARLLAPLL